MRITKATTAEIEQGVVNGTKPLYVVCDRCRKPTWSGMSADPATLAKQVATFQDNHTPCSHCGNMILWSKAELWPLKLARRRFPEMFTK